jgi:triacylglycerol esterase/lipase EstA (alpha/beta hydrolase family)
VLCVHGLNDDRRTFDALSSALKGAGFRHVEAMDLLPSDSSVSLRVLAEQVERAAEALLRTSNAPRIDVVGFSMGALVSRCWMLLRGGATRVRRFVSISGPHRGTWTAYLRRTPGAREMRPESPLLRELEAQQHLFGDVERHAFWTPLDLMILPPSSASLHGAVQRTFTVALHPWMLTDARVLSAVRDALAAPARTSMSLPNPGRQNILSYGP